jgi:hypothetical protein
VTTSRPDGAGRVLAWGLLADAFDVCGDDDAFQRRNLFAFRRGDRRICNALRPDSADRVFAGQWWSNGAMSKQLGSIALVAASLLAGGLQANTARADECLAAPNSRAPQGSHWHYRTDKTSHQKCWYLRSQDQATQQLVPQDKTETAPVSPVAATVAAPDAQGAAGDSQPPIATTNDSAQKPAQGVSSQQRSIRQAAPSAATVNWPNPAPLASTVTHEEAVATPDTAQPDATPQQHVANAPVAKVTQDGAQQGDARNAEPSPEADNQSDGLLGSLTATPVGMFLIVAMALAVAGILSRAVMKIASARRRRVYVDHDEQDWIESIPPEQTPSIAARTVDLAYAPAERVDRNDNELESALRRFMRERDRRAA